MPHGRILTRFVETCLGDDDAALESTRNSVLQAMGEAAFVDVCATVASFNAVVKLADATGIPLEEAKEARTRDIRATLSIEEFRR